MKNEKRKVFKMSRSELKLKFRKKVVVKFGKAISPENMNILNTDPREVKKIKQTIMNQIVDLVETDNEYIDKNDNW